ncbi:MAG: hypothetical protein BWY17_01313 [Deltaproteobacteria bacterium ADurb.Bin207]|jgi:hypothetical protein|nr:MAG: hypothetical protein BWY17_01313 [Deltaproteobacteria bacterium ADurb.Bin207]
MLGVMTLRCGVCGSERLSPAYQWVAFQQHFNVPDADKGWLGSKNLVATESVKRVCLDCGHVMGFVSDETLQKIRAAT